VPDVEDWTHHWTTLLSVKNLDFLDLTTSITWDRVAQPVPREDGSIPIKDDLRTTFGFGIES
jgi:long-subunit fatty acid transport protein